MKYTTSILTLGALAPLLVAAYPANSTLSTRDDHHKCDIGFNHHPCGDFNTDVQFRFKPKYTDDRMAEVPAPDLPQNIQLVSHCFDFADRNMVNPDNDGKNGKDPDAKPQYGRYGRTILESDQRPLFTYLPSKAHMWVFDDGCKEDFSTVAVFENPGCTGKYFWYNMAKVAATNEPAVTKANPGKSLGVKDDWCVAPFDPLQITVGSMQLWKNAPTDAPFQLG